MERMRQWKWWLGLCVIAIYTQSASAALSTANKAALKQALVFYNSGKYQNTLEALEKIKGDPETQSTVYYWQGLCYFKQKNYEQAIQSFTAARRLGSKAEDLLYNLGQSYFASQKLKEAVESFDQSVAIPYKVGPSLYYLGYIHQLLNQYKKANEYYLRLVKLPSDEDKVKQPALFQMAEIRYELAKALKPDSRRNNALEKEVLPVYERASDFASDTSAFTEADQRITEISSLLEKSKPSIQRDLSFRATFEFSYDSNVITKADESLVSVSNQDSFVFNPTLRTTYDKQLPHDWSMEFGLRTAAKLYHRRSVPDIYKNDNLLIEPSLGFERRHKIFSKPGTLFLNTDFTYELQDSKKEHHFPYYSRAYNFEVGERADFFKTGQTSLKSNVKFYENTDETLNSIQPGVDFNQKISIGSNKVSTTIAIDWLYSRVKTNETITYKFNNRYPIDLSKDLTLTPKFNFSYLDPKLQRPTRGYEPKYNPGISLRKVYKDGKIVRLNYDFTRNISNDRANYQYKRHEASISLEYRF